MSLLFEEHATAMSDVGGLEVKESAEIVFWEKDKALVREENVCYSKTRPSGVQIATTSIEEGFTPEDQLHGAKFETDFEFLTEGSLQLDRCSPTQTQGATCSHKISVEERRYEDRVLLSC